MKKRILSALLVLCLACGLVSTAWAADGQSTPETAAVSVTDAASGETAQEESASDETVVASAYPARTEEQTVPGTDVTVQVGVPEGALPEDAKLTTALVGSSEDAADDQAVADVASELDKAEVEYDGFVALDISFVDADGNKVEPLQPVSVNFTLPAELLPEDVDASTLEVQHLEENAAGEVENVATVADTADATEGTVTVEAPAATLSAAPAAEDEAPALPENAEVTAEFTVNGFSTFTITWIGHDGWSEEPNPKSMSFILVDTDGQEINIDLNATPDAKLEYTLPSGQEKFFGSNNGIVDECNIRNITGTDGNTYTFQNATLVLNDGRDRHPVDSVKRVLTGMDIVLDYRKAALQFKDSVYGENGYYTREELKNGERVELVYRRTTDDEVIVEPEPTYEKKAILQSDGTTYELSLNVSGDIGSSSVDQKVDVLFIIDSSASMKESFGHGQSRQVAVANSIESLVNKIKAQDGINERFAVVQFGDEIKSSQEQNYYRDGLQLVSWTDDTTYLMSKVRSIKCSGGTNYQAGLLDAQADLIEARPDALKYVVFLSDGAPTYYYDDAGKQQGLGSEIGSNIESSLQAAKEEAKNLPQLNGFFTVFVGSQDDASNLVELSNNVKAEDKLNETASNLAELEKAFEKLTGQMTTLACAEVKIEDTLSQYVEPVKGASASLKIYKTQQVDGESEDVLLGEDDPVYNDVTVGFSNNKLTLTTVDDATLLPNYTYTVSLLVQPSDKAYSEYAKQNKYNATGWDNTGTHSGSDGFYSNDSATLDYKVKGVAAEQKTYPMPVIQVPSTSLTINKTMAKLPKDQWDTAAGNITFTVKDGATSVADINLGTTPPDSANYTIQKTETGYTVVVNGLTVTKEYTVTETCGKLEGYNVTSTLAAAGQQIKMDKDAAQNKLDVTNTYTPANQTLTITKTVGGEMGSYTDDFTFTLTLKKAGSSYTTPLAIEESTTAKDANGNQYTGTLTATDGTYTFVLSNDEQMVLSVPYGYDVTVTEQQENNGYTVSSQSYETGTTGEGLQPNKAEQTVQEISKDYTVEFANNRNPVAPTGLESNHTAPYTILVTVAGIAGLALIGGIVARRRRRRME